MQQYIGTIHFSFAIAWSTTNLFNFLPYYQKDNIS